LLEKLFKAFYIPRVYEEILRAKEKGYFVDYIIRLIDDRKIKIATLIDVDIVKELRREGWIRRDGGNGSGKE